MVADNLLLHFLPRSLQLNMSKTNTNHKPSRGVSNPSPSDSKRKEEEDSHTIEEHYSYKKLKKKKSKDYTEVSQQPIKRSAGFHQLDDVIAGFLSSRGLSNTLSTFLSEIQHEFPRNTQKVKLEDVYHHYCHQIHESPRKDNSEEGNVNRENGFGKPDVDAQTIEESRNKKNNKRKSRKSGNAHMANHFIKTSNGFSEAKTHASEIDFRRSGKSKDSGVEAVNDFSGHRKNTEKANKNLEPVIRTHNGSAENLNASNKLEQIFDYAEPLHESKKSKGEKKRKKVASDEMNVTDNNEKKGGKKSKKVTTLGKEAQRMKYHALHGEAKRGRAADLRQDLENTTNIEVSKKEKKEKKKKKLADTTPRDDGELGDTGVKLTMALRKSQATGSNTEKRESDKEIVEDLSEDFSTSPNIKVMKEEMKKSSQKALAYKNKKNKKEEKAMEKLQVTVSHVINGGAKGVKGSLSQDTGNTQSITLAHKDFETNRSLLGESESLEKSSTGTISQSKSMPGNEDGTIETKEHISPKTKEYKQKKETPTTERAFRRVRVEEVNFVDPMLGDNSYWAKDGAENGYGAKAQEVLGQVRGKGFRHEKTKKKRGSYTGGTIDLQSHSIKFSCSDNDE